MAELLVDQLRTMARLVPREVGFRNVDSGEGLTFEDWDRGSNRFARGLVAAGVSKGDRVAIDLPGEDAIRWVVTYAGIHKAGAVAVPVNTRLSDRERATVLEHAEVIVTVTPGTWEDYLGDDDADIQVPVGNDDLADILYTSGTTGTPKGVAVRHGTIAMMPNTEPAWSGAGWIHSSPLFTFAGIGFIYNPMKMGMVSLYQPRFDAGRWIEVVERERPQAAFLVPAMAQLIVNHERFETADLSSLELVSIGSAPLPHEVLRRLQEKVPGASVSNSYGMTEAGAAYCVMPKGESLKRPGSVGLPLPPAELRIVDETGADVGPNREGELLIRVPGKRREYYKDPEATAAAWDADGWLHTGDLARMDDDGYLYIVGRKKDVIIRGGHNVHALDVEQVVFEHPGVIDVAVAGIPHDVLGEDVAAFVVLRPGHEVSPQELEAFCRERLADYKVPRHWFLLDELPRNATGKVLKRELVARVTSRA